MNINDIKETNILSKSDLNRSFDSNSTINEEDYLNQLNIQ